MISDKQFNFLLAGLTSGLGLAKSAEIALLDIKEVSDFMRNNTEKLQQAREAVAYSSHVLLSTGQKMLEKKNFAAWEANNEKLRAFVVGVVLWEQDCKRKDVTESKVLEAYAKYSSPGEVATAIGMTRGELSVYMIEHADLCNFIKDNPHVTK